MFYCRKLSTRLDCTHVCSLRVFHKNHNPPVNQGATFGQSRNIVLTLRNHYCKQLVSEQKIKDSKCFGDLAVMYAVFKINYISLCSCQVSDVWDNSRVNFLTHFIAMFYVCTPCKYQEISGFLMFSGGIK